MNQQLIHFDSAFAQLDNLNDPFSCTFSLANPLRNVNQITLKSIEIPVAFNNIRNSGTLNQFGITIGGTVYSITLSTNNYASISTLCTDITTAFTGLTLPNNAILTMSAGTTNVIVSLVSTVQTNFVVNQTQLSFYILGFKNQSAQINTTSGSNRTSTINALNSFNLNIDNYANFSIINLPVLNNANCNGIISSFKIPLNCLTGEVLYLEENQTFKQSVLITNNGIVINSLKVVITDRFGNSLSNNGIDYSFSLGFVFKHADEEI